MKKLVVIAICLAYLAVSSGVIVNLHYCMNRLASADLFTSESEKCGKCGMDIHKSDGCCRDEVKLLKMDEDQRNNPVAVFELPELDDISVKPSAFICASFYKVPGKKHFLNHSPPLISEQETYLQNRVFRI